MIDRALVALYASSCKFPPRKAWTRYKKISVGLQNIFTSKSRTEICVFNSTLIHTTFTQKLSRLLLGISLACMVSDRLIPPSSDLRTHLVHPPIHQPPTPDDNNIRLLIDRESSILKLNRLVCLIMWRGDWVISLVRLTILYGAPTNERSL